MAWDRVRGHEANRAVFEAAFVRGRLGHAYLFTGPPGVGKRLFAAELTKALLCEHPPRPLAACDRCAACHLCDAGTHPDVSAARTPEDKLELPVETVREFCARLALKPSRGFRKVGVVEDADDFNEESANAFLKTLEEPAPGSLLLLLATTEEGQLPTIRSRCQVVRFRPLPPADVAAVLKARGVADPARVEHLVRLAGGSPGQAFALNDETVWDFYTGLAAAACRPKPAASELATRLARFVEAAGKEGAVQRPRASAVVRLLLDLAARALRVAAGVGPAESAESSQLRALAQRLGPDGLADVMETLADADYLLDRRVTVGLVLDAVADAWAAGPANSG
jgi:DNA polymerase-3 subunit delta'